MAKRLELLYNNGVIWANANYRYWNTSLSPDDWTSVASSAGTNRNPITAVHLSDAVGGSRKAKVTIINRPRQMGSSTANEGKGRFTGAFTDFQSVRLRDGENGTILLAGKIYDIDEKFDFRYGTSIVLDIRDSLEELKSSRTGGWPDKAFTGGSTTRSSMINDFIAGNIKYVNSSIIATNGENKVTTSRRPQESGGELEFKGNKIALVEIAQLAAEEPHSPEGREGFQIALAAEALDTTETGVDVDNLTLGYANAAAALSPSILQFSGDYIQIDGEIMKVLSVSTNTITVIRGVRGTTAVTHLDNAQVFRNPGASRFGFDYHVDPAVVSSGVIAAAAPAQHWNYYQRGTRPDSPKTYGMTITYPAASSFTSDGFNKLMQNDFAFKGPHEEMYTDVILEYTEKGSQVKGDASIDKGVSGGASVAKRRKFERLDIVSAGGRLAVEGYVVIGRLNGAATDYEFVIPIDEFELGDAYGTTEGTADLVVNVGDYISIDNEIMKVASRSGGNITVVSQPVADFKIAELNMTDVFEPDRILNASDTTIHVDSIEGGYANAVAILDAYGGSISPSSYIQIDSEIMKITSISTNTIGVTRGQRSTSAAPHNNGVDVKLLPARIAYYGGTRVTHTNNDSIIRNPFGDTDNWGGKPFGQTELMSVVGQSAFGRIEYQSHIAGSGLDAAGLEDPAFIVVSPYNDAADTDDLNFNALMPETYQQLRGSTSLNTVYTNGGTTTRLAKTFGFRRTKIIKNSTSSDPSALRRQVVSFLSRDAQTGTKRGEFKVSGYPYTYINAAAADVSRSSGTITFASDAFADNNSGTTGDARLFGVLVGDVICEMDSTATTITRYAYISSLPSATTVIYAGNVAANTSDGTALDASKPMRIYVPLRAGHVVRVVNSLVQVDKDHLVTEIVYDEGNGTTFASLSTIGINDSAALFSPSIFKEVKSNEVSYGPSPADSGNADNFNEV